MIHISLGPSLYSPASLHPLLLLSLITSILPCSYFPLFDLLYFYIASFQLMIVLLLTPYFIQNCHFETFLHLVLLCNLMTHTSPSLPPSLLSLSLPPSFPLSLSPSFSSWSAISSVLFNLNDDTLLFCPDTIRMQWFSLRRLKFIVSDNTGLPCCPHSTFCVPTEPQTFPWTPYLWIYCLHHSSSKIDGKNSTDSIILRCKHL